MLATLALCFAPAPIVPAVQTTPAKRYKGKLERVEGAGGENWSVGPEDVWRLESFEYEFKGKLAFEFGPSTVVIASHEDEKGRRSALWAALFPDEPAPITASEPGHGDHASAVFMRFHPSLVGDLFPKKTVEGPGDPLALVRAKRQYAHKINGALQWNNMPVVPDEKWLVFDADTVEGKRRFYFVNGKEASVKYEEAFAHRKLPPMPTEGLDDPDAATKAFDAAWSAFDREYAMFGLRPDVDWDALKERYRPLAERARSPYELAGVIGLLVTHLEDLHVWVKQDGQWVWTFNRFRTPNANWKAVEGKLSGINKREGLTWGRVDDSLGYVVVWNLSNNDLSDRFDEALEALGDTTGLIVDLRFNGGGSETLGRRIAARFLDEEAVYATNRYRNGEGHDELGDVLERKFEPRGPWRYEAPVIVLQGPSTMSSAESMVQMFQQCPEVTTMGVPTTGSSGNPRNVDCGLGIVVNLPRWIDMGPDGTPIDRVGVPPDVEVGADLSPGDFRQSDPVFDEALKRLSRSRNKKPGKRG